MKWRKLGQLYAAGNIHPKLCSHAANPLAIPLKDDVFRVYFSGRDNENRSSVGFVEIDLGLREVIRVKREPVFLHGTPGSFYSHGVSIGSCYEVKGVHYVLFMGWRVPRTGHWYGEIGRLIVEPDGGLRLDGDSPFVGLDGVDAVSLSYPWILREPTGRYRMWYGSTLAWDAGNGGMLHVIKHAESDDGHTWRRQGVAVPYELGVAQAFSRPTVARDPDGGYEMWFSYRDDLGRKYRIGSATSKDGMSWDLELEKPGIDVSTAGWDSEMIEYPYVFDHDGERFMLYCGNGYGLTGFGLAVLERGGP